jgi:hypothetical protein
MAEKKAVVFERRLIYTWILNDVQIKVTFGEPGPPGI